MTIASVAEEILAKWYRPLNKKDKSKNNNGSLTSDNNSKSSTTQNNLNNQNNNNQNVDSKRQRNENEMTNPMCSHCKKRCIKEYLKSSTNVLHKGNLVILRRITLNSRTRRIMH